MRLFLLQKIVPILIVPGVSPEFLTCGSLRCFIFHVKCGGGGFVFRW